MKTTKMLRKLATILMLFGFVFGAAAPAMAATTGGLWRNLSTS